MSLKNKLIPFREKEELKKQSNKRRPFFSFSMTVETAVVVREDKETNHEGQTVRKSSVKGSKKKVVVRKGIDPADDEVIVSKSTFEGIKIEIL